CSTATARPPRACAAPSIPRAAGTASCAASPRARGRGDGVDPRVRADGLEHDPEKACPGHLIRGGYRFPPCPKPLARSVVWLDASAGRRQVGKRSCSTNKLERDDDSKKSHLALGSTRVSPAAIRRSRVIHSSHVWRRVPSRA